MRLTFRSKDEMVSEQLRTAIISGEHEPGTRLVIDQLAADLGVSQIPIREAVKQLEADGFVTIEPYAGATITEINASLIFEIFALLESLEVICSRAACRQIDADELEALAELVARMDADLDDPEKWSRDNKAFHLFIWECSKSALANGMLMNVLDHWDRLRFHYLKSVFELRIKDAQDEHKQIAEAIEARNPARVEALIRQHNQNALASYIAYLRTEGELAPDSEDIYV